MKSGLGRIAADARAWLAEHHAALDAAPGVLGSLFLHGMALTLVVLMLMRQPVQPPEPHFVPVDLVSLGDETTAPPVPVHAPAPQQKAAHGPLAAPRPEGVRPNATRPAVDPLEVQLRNFAKLRRPDSDLRLSPDGASDMTATSNGAAPGPAAYSVRDYIRAQVLRRWSLDLATLGDRHMVIALHVRLTKTGALAKITILDRQRYNKDPVYRDIAISARNAVILSAPFHIPGGVARPARDFTLTLDPRDTLR